MNWGENNDRTWKTFTRKILRNDYWLLRKTFFVRLMIIGEGIIMNRLLLCFDEWAFLTDVLFIGDEIALNYQKWDTCYGVLWEVSREYPCREFELPVKLEPVHDKAITSRRGTLFSKFRNRKVVPKPRGMGMEQSNTSHTYCSRYFGSLVNIMVSLN